MMSGIYNVHPGIIMPTTAYQIDSKIDDGLPSTGSVQVGFSYVGGQSGGTDQQGYQNGDPHYYRQLSLRTSAAVRHSEQLLQLQPDAESLVLTAVR